MANSGNIQAELRLEVVCDSDSTVATGTPITIVCNRQYNIVDYCIAVTTAANEANERVIIENSTSGVTQGNAVATSVAVLRPTALTVGVGDTGLLSNASVSRLSTLRVRAFSGALTAGASTRFEGTIVILPGNRYASGNGTYYPNNASALQYRA